MSEHAFIELVDMLNREVHIKIHRESKYYEVRADTAQGDGFVRRSKDLGTAVHNISQDTAGATPLPEKAGERMLYSFEHCGRDWLVLGGAGYTICPYCNETVAHYHFDEF